LPLAARAARLPRGLRTPARTQRKQHAAPRLRAGCLRRREGAPMRVRPLQSQRGRIQCGLDTPPLPPDPLPPVATLASGHLPPCHSYLSGRRGPVRLGWGNPPRPERKFESTRNPRPALMGAKMGASTEKARLTPHPCNEGGPVARPRRRTERGRAWAVRPLPPSDLTRGGNHDPPRLSRYSAIGLG